MDYIENFDNNSEFNYYDDTESDDSDTEAPYLMLISKRKISVSLFIDFCEVSKSDKCENNNEHLLKFDDYDYAIKYSLSGWHDIKGEWQIFVDSKECDNILGCWRIDDDKDNEVSGENGTAPWWHRRSTFNPLGKKIDDGCIAYSYGKIGISEDMFSTNDFDLLVRAITRSIEGLYTNNLKRLWEDMGKKGRIIVEGLVMLTTDEDFPYIESVTIGSL